MNFEIRGYISWLFSTEIMEIFYFYSESWRLLALSLKNRSLVCTKILELLVIVLYSLLLTCNTVCLQMNGAVSKVNKKFISHLTRAKSTPSAAVTVQVSHALPAVRFSCLLRGRGVAGSVSKLAPQQEKAFCVLRFEV